MTTINSIIDMLVKGGLNEAMAFEYAEAEDVNAELSGYTWMADEAEAVDHGIIWDDEDDDRGWDDYDDISERYGSESSVVYLDDVLEGLDENTNVLIYLNSARISYCDFNDAPIVVQDAIGNHTASNWLDALNLVHLNHALDAQYGDTMYVVRAFVKGDAKNVKVYLDATRDSNHTVHELEFAGNLYARKDVFGY